jgi:hypothetical protein
VPAAKVEAVVVDAVRRHIGGDVSIDNAELISTYVSRIDLGGSGRASFVPAHTRA